MFINRWSIIRRSNFQIIPRMQNINVINRIHHATALTDNEFSSFLRSLRFFLGQAGKEEQKKLIDVRLGAFAIVCQSLRSSSSPLWNGQYLATKYEHVMF
jgi:hypothetical protein